MKIIGINSELDGRLKKIDTGGVALIIDGEIIVALAEERVSRIKHDGGYTLSLEKVLDFANLSLKDIDYFFISFYGTPYVIPEKLIQYHIKKLQLDKTPEKLIVVSSHHISHAYASFFLSPFDEAIIMVSDSEGSELLMSPDTIAAEGWCERNSYYTAKHNQIDLIHRDFEEPLEIGFGKAFTRFTRYIGLGDYHAAGKTMGLSSYGKLSKDMKEIDLWNLDKKGYLITNIKTNPISGKGLYDFFKDRNISIPPFGNKQSYQKQEYQNLAAYIQYQLMKWSERKLSILIKKYKIKNICIGGGVGLNSMMNSYLEKKLGVKIFVPPYPSDEGQALGNAIYGYMQKSNLMNNSLMNLKRFSNFTYLGPNYTNVDIQDALNKADKNWIIKKSENICSETAKLLKENKFIGWFQGRSEYGARALGNRSILANPTIIENKNKLNISKGRELFRPFAPSVMEDYILEYFEGENLILEEYMLSVNNVKKDKIDKIPAVVHIDNTARVQKVKKNTFYYNLIKNFFDLSGIPIVLNTSFNYAGEPIIETPLDAIYSAEKLKLDVLVLNDYLLIRK